MVKVIVVDWRHGKRGPSNGLTVTPFDRLIIVLLDFTRAMRACLASDQRERLCVSERPLELGQGHRPVRIVMMLSHSITKTVLPLGVVAGIFVLIAFAARTGVTYQRPEAQTRVSADADSVVSRVDRLFADRWGAADVHPPTPPMS